MRRCHKCGAEWVSEKRQPGVTEYCDSCSAYLHSCLNCRFHDKYAPNQCRIPNTEGISDRAGANFCDEFEFVHSGESVPSTTNGKGPQAALDQLFGAAEPKKSLDDLKKLFGD